MNKYIISICLLLISGMSIAKPETYILKQADWNIARTAESVLSIPALRQSIAQYQSSELSQLKLYYPGGDEGTLWVNELRAWLISLGVESSSITVIPGSGNPDEIQIKVLKQ